MASKVVIKKEKGVDGSESSASTSLSTSSNKEAVAPTNPRLLEAAEARLLELAKELPTVTQDDIDKDPQCSSIPKAEFLPIINRLIKQAKLTVHQKGQGPTSQLYYKLGKTTTSVAVKAAGNASNEEKLLLQIIEEVGPKGIWTKEIRNRTGLNQTTLTKVLKNLESKKLIKSVTSVQASKKKMYLLYNVVPDSSLTGGPWWSNGEFDIEFVELLHKICLGFLESRSENAKKLEGGPLIVKNASFISSSEILRMLVDLKVSKTTLSVTDIESILDTIVYDGKAEMTIDGSSAGQPSKRYRIVESPIASAGFVHIPCGVCPVINRCSTIGSITAKTCEYFDAWGDDI